MSGSANPPAASNRPSMSGFSARKDEFVYRPISVMAVLCLIASLFALLSFVSLYMIPVAVIILIVSVVTYIRLERSRNEYAGQVLAGLAVVITLIGTVGAGTAHAVTFYAYSTEARGLADQYLAALLADNLEEAFLLRTDPQSRASVSDDVNDLVKTYNKAYEGFKKEAVTKALRAGGANSIVEFKRATDFYPFNGLSMVGLHYQVQLATEPKKKYDVVLGIVGGVSEAGDWEGRQWYIQSNESIDEVPTQPQTPSK